MMNIKLDFATLPEAKDWKDGETYDVHLTVKQVSSDATGAEFEVVEAQGEMMNQDMGGEVPKPGAMPAPVSRIGQKGPMGGM